MKKGIWTLCSPAGESSNSRFKRQWWWCKCTGKWCETDTCQPWTCLRYQGIFLILKYLLSLMGQSGRFLYIYICSQEKLDWMYLIDHSRATLHHFGLYQCFVSLLNLPQMFGLIKTGIFDMILQICVVGSYLHFIIEFGYLENMSDGSSCLSLPLLNKKCSVPWPWTSSKFASCKLRLSHVVMRVVIFYALTFCCLEISYGRTKFVEIIGVRFLSP